MRPTFHRTPARLCLKTNAGSCGSLSPDSIGLIYDEDRFRVDLFINPRLLKTLAAAPDPFLPTPSAPLSLTSAVGVAASGSIGGTPVYNLQNRTVIALHNARLRTSNSIASKLGWVVDDFVGEVDHRDLRYSAGLFWAPGDDFIGQRRIIGGGIGTQFDTRADRAISAAPRSSSFCPSRRAVEILVDGRLVSARSYPAGNNELDTSALGDGSYPILLRIHERSGAVRDEQRFFVKSAHIAPKGHPVYFAYAGVLANTRAHRPVSVSKTLFYQAGIAWRIDNAVALDLSAMGTQHKAILEAGGWLIARPVRARAAAIASSAGDLGGLLQLSSSGHGLVNFNFDLRRIWSHGGRPLIPLSPPVETFDWVVPTGLQLATGSYTQAIGSIGVRLEAAICRSLAPTARIVASGATTASARASICRSSPAADSSFCSKPRRNARARSRRPLPACACSILRVTCRWPAVSDRASRTNGTADTTGPCVRQVASARNIRVKPRAGHC